MNKYDIVLIPFPFSDLSEIKLRPALVLAPLKGNNAILCQITTKKRSTAAYEIPLEKLATQGNIRFDSNIYVDMIFTLEKEMIVRKIGRVANLGIIQKIIQKIHLLFFH